MTLTKQRPGQGVVTLAIKFDNVLMFHSCSLLPCHVSVSYIHLNATGWIVQILQGIQVFCPVSDKLAYNNLQIMDFLDPKKQKAHTIRLAIGYTLMGLVLLLATTILLYRAYGFGLDKDGRIIQNGLVFVNSQPDGAEVYVNGRLYKDQTNTRLVLPGGQYTVELKRDGYHTWRRAITVEGGSVGRFYYPFLFPSKLTTSVTKQYASAPLLATQSPDHRWLIVQTLTPDQFDIYDLEDEKPVPQTVTIPAEALTPAASTQDWEMVDWADDNRRVVLKRTYQKDGQTGQEYILFDRDRVAESRNLSVAFGFTPTTLELVNHKFDRYYLFDQNSAQVFTATLSQPTPQPLLSDVLAFAADQESVLFATTVDAPAGKVQVKLRQGDVTYTIRQLPVGGPYLLDLARYRGTWLVAAGAQAENRVYVYKNPAARLEEDENAVLVPLQILKVEKPNFVSFSPNARFVMAENTSLFAVYDAEIDKGYGYDSKLVLDAPQQHATWMDGFHLQAVSGGKLVVFDFDGANAQTLSVAVPDSLPFYTPNYQLLYSLTPQNALTNTSLLTPADQ